MLAAHIVFAAVKKITVFFRKIIKAGNRNKFIATQVADLIFYVSLFPAGSGIHKYWLNAVVLTETLETLRYITPAAFNDLGDNGPGIVKPDFRWNPTDVLKYGGQTLQEALHVFAVIKLQKTAITKWKTEYKVLGFVMKLAIFIKISCSKIRLGFAGAMFEGNIANGSF